MDKKRPYLDTLLSGHFCDHSKSLPESKELPQMQHKATIKISKNSRLLEHTIQKVIRFKT